MNGRICCCLVAFLASCSVSVFADGMTPAVFKAVSRYSGVPQNVLYAVALVESGKGAGDSRKPHPWTLNIAGKPHYFDSREAMFETLMATLKTGQSNVDIGPMQLNWHWQHERLISPWMATDPVYNLKEASAIIAGFYARTQDWKMAIGKYHRSSDEPRHKAAAHKYMERVISVLEGEL